MGAAAGVPHWPLHTVSCAGSVAPLYSVQDGVKWHRVERSSGSLRRHVKLPPTANLDSVTAACDNGMLRVTVGKHPDAIDKGPRKITVA